MAKPKTGALSINIPLDPRSLRHWNRKAGDPKVVSDPNEDHPPKRK